MFQFIQQNRARKGLYKKPYLCHTFFYTHTLTQLIEH